MLPVRPSVGVGAPPAVPTDPRHDLAIDPRRELDAYGRNVSPVGYDDDLPVGYGRLDGHDASSEHDGWDGDPDEQPDEEPEQSRLAKLLWGDKAKKGKSGGGRKEGRTQRDPSLPGMWQVKAMRAGLLGLLAIGALGGGKSLLSSGDASDATSTDAPVVEPEPELRGDVGVGGFTELYVAAWLSAGERSERPIAQFYPETVSFRDTEAARYRAVRTATLEVTEEGEGYWSVTVAAEVVRSSEDEEGQEIEEPLGIRYYTVGVVRGEIGFVATSLPAQVPAPATLVRPERVIEDLASPTGELEAVSQALEGFFAALLTGSGEIDRYVISTNQIKAITPAPFTVVEIDSLGARPDVNDPSVMLVMVEIMGIDSEDNATVMNYTLTVQQRSERWEVSELMAAAPLMGAEDADSAPDDGDNGPDDGDTTEATDEPTSTTTGDASDEPVDTAEGSDGSDNEDKEQ